jgi:hypothetical protein
MDSPDQTPAHAPAQTLEYHRPWDRPRTWADFRRLALVSTAWFALGLIYGLSISGAVFGAVVYFDIVYEPLLVIVPTFKLATGVVIAWRIRRWSFALGTAASVLVAILALAVGAYVVFSNIYPPGYVGP